MSQPTLFSVFTWESFSEFRKTLQNGTTTVEEYRRQFDVFTANKEQIIQELSAMTKKDLLNKLTPNGQYRYKNEVKERVVQGVYDAYLSTFQLGTFTYMPFSEKYDDAMRRYVYEQSQSNLDEYGRKCIKEAEDYERRRKEHMKAISNPETLDEFKLFIKIRGMKDLNPDQKRAYDALVSAQIIENRVEETITKARVEQVENLNTDMRIIETEHTRDKYRLWVVQLEDRVEREVYNDLNAKAKQLGGYYSSYRGNGATSGFQFKSKEQAEKFLALKEGNVLNTEHVEAVIEAKEEKRAAKLRANAEKMIKSADEQLNRERLTNTYRRAAQADSAERKALKEKSLAKTMINLANAIDEGYTTYLNYINSKTQVELFNYILAIAKRRELNEKYPNEFDRRQHVDDPATIETVDYVSARIFPDIYVDHVIDLAKKAEIRIGCKLIARKWLRATSSMEKNAKVSIHSHDHMLEIITMFNSLSENDRKYHRVAELIATYKRIKAMKIENDSMLREALREFVIYRSEKDTQDPVKILERKLAGRGRNVGFDFFPTPADLCDRMVVMANLEEGQSILEPSAGNGNIADAIRRAGFTPDVIEISGELREILIAKKYSIVGQDFMQFNETKYDRIIMNPPFSNGFDADHIMHAYELLKPRGRIVAIAGEGIFYRSDKKALLFRDWISDKLSHEEELEDGTFMDKKLYATTGAKARLLIINK